MRGTPMGGRHGATGGPAAPANSPRPLHPPPTAPERARRWRTGNLWRRTKRLKGCEAGVRGERAAAWRKEQGGRRRGGGHPYFCFVSLEAPHPPYHAVAPHVAEVKPEELKLRANVPEGAEKQAREELAGYYAHIEATDRAIGKLLTEVDLTETIVVFTSVHGDMHGGHGLFRKAWPYAESIL